MDTNRSKYHPRIMRNYVYLSLGNLFLLGVTFFLYNAFATFQTIVLWILSDLIHDCIELYMENFTIYSDSFEEALKKPKKVLKRY